jgi:hypothetical protein
MSVGPVQSLFDATEEMRGKTVDLEGVYDHITMVAWAKESETGSDRGTVTLQGSHNGRDWVRLGEVRDIYPANPGYRVGVFTVGGPGNFYHLVRYVRADLTSLAFPGNPRGEFSATIAAR